MLPSPLIDPNEQTTLQAGSDTKLRRTLLAAYFRIADFTSEPKAYRAEPEDSMGRDDEEGGNFVAAFNRWSASDAPVKRLEQVPRRPGPQ